MKIEKKYIILLAISGFVVSLDQWSKLFVHTRFFLGESLPVIQDYFHISYVRNTGAAFGMLSDLNKIVRDIFFLSLTPVALIIAVNMIRNINEKESPLQVFGLCFIVGGAIGNYIDRIRLGYVIDFLDFHFKKLYSWPVFNFADTAISIGIFLVSLALIFEWLEERKKKS